MAGDEELIHGVPASFWNESKVTKVLVFDIFMIIIIVLAIGLRLYARYFARIALWWDDYLALASIVS